MSNRHLLELLSLDRKAQAKLPDWNAQRRLELFGGFIELKLYRTAVGKVWFSCHASFQLHRW